MCCHYNKSIISTFYASVSLTSLEKSVWQHFTDVVASTTDAEEKPDYFPDLLDSTDFDKLSDITSNDDWPHAEEKEGIGENSTSEEAECSDKAHKPNQ